MKFISIKEVSKKTCLSRVTIWRLERKGKLPKRYSLSERRVAWKDDEINDWILERKEWLCSGCEKNINLNLQENNQGTCQRSHLSIASPNSHFLHALHFYLILSIYRPN